MWFAKVVKMNGNDVDGILTLDDNLDASDIGNFDSRKKLNDFIRVYGYLLNVIIFNEDELPTAIYKYKDNMEKGGSIDEHKETYEKWKSLVNMSQSELKEFYDSQEGKDAGLSDKESNDLGISNGRESARWIMRMKDTPVSDWTPKMWEWANKQISFISRMSGNKGSLYDDKGNKTRKHTSLLIWGHNPEKMGRGGDIKDLILSKKIELNFYRTTPDHALEYGIKAKNPLYLKNFYVTKSERLKGIGKKMLKYLDDYAIENGNDVIFGHIGQKATFSKNKETYLNDTQLIKNWLHDNGYAVNDDDNNFHKVVGDKMKQGGEVITYRNKFNKKYGFELNESHSLEEIAKLTNLKLSALQDIYNKGIGAYKTNPESVRPIVKSKEQWAMARVYSAVMGGKASKVDANELERGKMEEGGEIELKQKQLEIINRTNPAPNEYNTWIRTVKDIKTAEEVFSIAFEEGAMYPDFQMDDITKAIESGYVTIFSSYPIKEGVFVTTSKMNAQDYAGGKGGKVFSKKVQLKDIAWIDEGEGQYAPTEYFANGGNIPYSNMELLAPNGNKSNLNHEQWHLVRTPAFKQWFGDWEKLAMAKIKDSAMDEVTLANISKDVSKVVDSNGEPLVVYRGSRASTQNVSGLWLSKSKSYAEGFGDIMQYFVKIIKPMPEYLFNKTWMVDYDLYDGRLGDFHKIVVKYPNQNKLADGTNTTFDGNNDDIRYEDGGSIDNDKLYVTIDKVIEANKFKGAYKKIFDLIEDDIAFHNPYGTEEEEYKDGKFHIVISPKPSSSIILKISKIPNVEIVNQQFKDGGGIEFVPEKKGTLIKGNEIIKYFEKVNGNYRLIFYTLNETKGKVPTMCHSFGYCEELDSENVTPKELVELIKKNNLMEKGGEVEDRISQIDKEKIIILNEVDILIREHKKLYRNIDISMPKSDAEKQSDKKIANLLSRANELVMEKRNLISKLNKMAKGDDIEYKEGGNIAPSYTLQTPSQEKSQLTYLQQILVRTKAFKDWFGDWEKAGKNFINDNKNNLLEHYKGISKAINMVTLEPLLTYHGTMVDEEFFVFNVFAKQNARPYAYFAYNEAYSYNFSRGKTMYKCFLLAKNPFMAIGDEYELKREGAEYWINTIIETLSWDKYKKVVSDDKKQKLKQVVESQIGDYVRKVYDQQHSFWLLMARDTNSLFKAFLMSHGFTSVFYTEEYNTPFDPQNPSQYTRAITIFNASDIKLGDGRNLNFNPMKNDIRYDKGGEIDKEKEDLTIKNEYFYEQNKVLSKKDKLGKLLFGDKYRGN